MDITQAVEELTATLADYETEFKNTASQIGILLEQKPLQLNSLRILLKNAEVAARKSCESERDLRHLLLANDWEITHQDREFSEPETQLQDRIDTLKKFKKLLVPEILKDSIHTKLSTYLLNDKSDHRRARDKAGWFCKALGFSLANADLLENQIKLDFNKQIFRRTQTEYGLFFVQILPIEGANGRLIDVQFVWRIDPDGYFYLVTSRLGIKRNA